MKLTEREIFKRAMDKVALDPTNRNHSKQIVMPAAENVGFNNAVDKLCTSNKFAKYKTKTYGSRSHAKGCVRKKKYLSIHHANTKIKQTNNYRRAYLCGFCNYWHLTSQLPLPKRYTIELTHFKQLDELKIKLLEQIDKMFNY